MIDRDKAFPTGVKKVVDSLGERTVYDAVSQCSRCGYCEQSCPTYVETGDEAKSPRGRNQIVRMLLEGKIEEESLAAEALDSCLLCSSCTTTCYASVPTADLVLEGRRFLRRKESPRALQRWGTSLLFHRPRLFAWILRGLNLARLFWIDKFASVFGVFRLLGLRPLSIAAFQVRAKPLRLLKGRLGRRGGLDSDNPAWHYFPACGPHFLFPDVGEATIEVLEAFHGPGRVAQAGCCGLVAYNYGDLEEARAQARRVIGEFESGSPGAAPVVGDCSSCVSHLKNYPRLFLDEPEWKERAQALAVRLRDAGQMMRRDAVQAGCQKPRKMKPTTFHPACRSIHGQADGGNPEEALELTVGSKFHPLPDQEWCCGGAGTYAFTEPELSEGILRRKIDAIASTEAETVVATSTSCLLQLNHGLRKHYPKAKVVHLSEFIRDRLKK